MFENFRKKPKTEEKSKKPFSISRRGFLAYGAATAIGAGAGNIVGHNVADVIKGKSLNDFRRDAEETFNQVELNEQILVLKQFIKEHYGISVKTEQEDFTNITAKDTVQPLRLTKQIEALGILKEELSRYPDFMIKQYGLESILLTGYPKGTGGVINGRLIPGNIDATNEVEKSIIILSYDWNSEDQIPDSKRVDKRDFTDGDHSAEEIRQDQAKLGLRTTIHHELFHHFVDVEGSENSPRHNEDNLKTKWDDNFKAKNDEIRDYYIKNVPSLTQNGAPEFHKLDDDPIGAQRGYSLRNEKEDRATIIEDLMFFGPVLDRLESDPLLREKTGIILSYYEDASCGLMNVNYWQKIPGLNFTKTVEQHFFDTTKNILETPYEESEYTGSVSKERYTAWQNKLRTTRYANTNIKN